MIGKQPRDEYATLKQSIDSFEMNLLFRARIAIGQRPGFTLIELLVVIAIISVLAGILLPVLARTKQKGSQITCLSNLKQVGIATQMYTDDHEDFLPGPVYAGAVPNYDNSAGSRKTFIHHLAPYLGLPAPSPKMQVANIFICPAFRRASGDPGLMIGRKVYLLNDDVDPNPLNQVLPFGYPDAPLAAPPLKITAFDNYLPPSSVFAISDLDQSHPKLNTSNPGWFNELDKIVKPVHGTVRNNLFFDWHVEAVRW